MLSGQAQSCRNNERRWNALDPNSSFPFSNDDAAITQIADEVSTIQQRSRELIVIRDSFDVTVTSTETQVAVSLQAALQIAIALVIRISIADGNESDKITQDLLQLTRIQQVNRQSVFIENSRQVSVTMTDTDIAISIQLLLQILLALLVELDVF